MYSYYNEVTILTVWYFSETVAVGYFGQYKIVPLNSTESYGGIKFFFFSYFLSIHLITSRKYQLNSSF